MFNTAFIECLFEAHNGYEPFSVRTEHVMGLGWAIWVFPHQDSHPCVSVTGGTEAEVVLRAIAAITALSSANCSSDELSEIAEAKLQDLKFKHVSKEKNNAG